MHNRPSSEVVAICAELEADCIDLGDDEKQEFLDECGLTEPGLIAHTCRL